MTEGPREVDDLELVEGARQGDQGAVVELWTRHYPAALSVARRSARQPRDAEDIASDAFAGMLSAIAGGSGPTGSVRAYLVTSVRNVAASRARRGSAAEIVTDDNYVLEAAQVDIARDPVAEFTELGLVREAFAELPHRWQIVLWRTAVDHDSNIDVGRDMGLSPNGVAALARRAKRGLRVAYVRAHVSSHGVEPRCEPFIEHLADFAAPPSRSAADIPAPVRAHVASCTRCTARVSELRLVGRRMAGILGPAIIGLMPATMRDAAIGLASGSSSVTAPAVSPATVGRWAVATLGAAGVATVIFGLLHNPPTPPEEPPIAPTRALPSSTTSQPVPTPALTRTVAPKATPSSRPPSPARSPASTTPPAPPSPTPSSQPVVRTTPMAVSLEMGGTRSDTSVTVAAQAQGVEGPLTLHLAVPDGVTLARSQGDWVQCTQSGTMMTCEAAATSSGQWTGTLHTVWADEARGMVTATAAGTYSNGAPASGTVGTTWPP